MSRIIALVAFVVLSFISNACEKVPLLAPTDSTIFLTLGDTTNVGLNSTIQVTAIVTEGSGTAPQNGTVVSFSTTLGHLDPIEARTTNGRASTTFHTGNRSGTATLRAFSGAAGTGEGTATADVAIGGATVETVLLRAEAISGAGTQTTIVATVLDEDGNPVSGMTVAFSSDRGQVTPGTATTDGRGEARATLITSETTEVTATAGGAEGTINISAPGTINLQLASGSTPPFEVGQPISFTVEVSADTFFSNVVVDLGDGTSQNLGPVSGTRTFSHVYKAPGNFTVSARATGATGSPAQASIIIAVNNARAAVPVTFNSVTPNPVSLAAPALGLVNFSITATAPTNTSIARVEWDFGDNTGGQTTTGQTTNHRYRTTGTFIVNVRVITADGREGQAAITVVVTG